ncbi:hypothetical protein GKJPGBOP_01765 [Streptomyces paromomycinus]|uniref:Uncharacterized protein n=1 Tax=Streptomyces paromomycinus TaxID=92743 RepID=A0A401VYG5_STREY|nr:hypothetical protein GKJPGBOP_01765 [Streptomyces paromomycinus]
MSHLHRRLPAGGTLGREPVVPWRRARPVDPVCRKGWRGWVGLLTEVVRGGRGSGRPGAYGAARPEPEAAKPGQRALGPGRGEQGQAGPGQSLRARTGPGAGRAGASHPPNGTHPHIPHSRQDPAGNRPGGSEPPALRGAPPHPPTGGLPKRSRTEARAPRPSRGREPGPNRAGAERRDRTEPGPGPNSRNRSARSGARIRARDRVRGPGGPVTVWTWPCRRGRCARDDNPSAAAAAASRSLASAGRRTVASGLVVALPSPGPDHGPGSQVRTGPVPLRQPTRPAAGEPVTTEGLPPVAPRPHRPHIGVQRGVPWRRARAVPYCPAPGDPASSGLAGMPRRHPYGPGPQLSPA